MLLNILISFLYFPSSINYKQTQADEGIDFYNGLFHAGVCPTDSFADIKALFKVPDDSILSNGEGKTLLLVCS